jgi:hypothetical protein
MEKREGIGEGESPRLKVGTITNNQAAITKKIPITKPKNAPL